MWPVKHVIILIADRKCVVQTKSRVKWCQSNCRRREFHCLVMVLISAMFSRFLLDSFELQEMVGLTKHEATFSSPSISRRTYCSGYDEHACGTIIFQSLKLIVTTFCKKRPSCDRVIKRGPGRVLAISAHKRDAGKYMVSILMLFTVFEFKSSFWESVSVTFQAIFCWIHWVTISEFH